ncbi:hypothetical protein DEO23_11025 [Brachybacterium endophyticum]|uniref:Winged helix DNA-binding domain-containing protein n=1 Tax=Brachybacterium endophyticum TaxID=2182385 RepID=A0A2U2RIR6_9MICO|nr:crosslink repair DNA glycosylase YcaQ family protein [Brachybacterium endophyticum]PWH05731.1 hypothetical protein DEO23_11025 [Brachybacterium endophyticum]
MPQPDLVRARLLGQGLVTRPFGSAAAAASHLLASQAQDLPGVVGSLALRLGESDAGEGPAPGPADVIAAFDRGEIVRGYPMRGTVFVTAAADMRWLTELCAEGPLRAQRARRGALGLDQEQVDRARAVLEDTLAEVPAGLPRSELLAAWQQAGLASEKGQGYHLLSHLVASGVAVYGPWKDDDTAVVLANTHLPPDSGLEGRFDGDRTAAAAELLRRYLLGHGPATLRDAAWWSKLPLSLLRRALPSVLAEVEEAGADEAGETRYAAPGLAEQLASTPSAHLDALQLLPGFDEIVLGHPDRLPLLGEEELPLLVPGRNGIFRRGMIRRGRMIGFWRREGRPGDRRLELDPLGPMPAVARREAERAYATFPFVSA